jgi:hypothetical protein
MWEEPQWFRRMRPPLVGSDVSEGHATSGWDPGVVILMSSDTVYFPRRAYEPSMKECVCQRTVPVTQ